MSSKKFNFLCKMDLHTSYYKNKTHHETSFPPSKKWYSDDFLEVVVHLPSKAIVTKVYLRNSCQVCRQRYINSFFFFFNSCQLRVHGSNLNRTAPPEKERFYFSPVDTNPSGTFILKPGTFIPLRSGAVKLHSATTVLPRKSKLCGPCWG